MRWWRELRERPLLRLEQKATDRWWRNFRERQVRRVEEQVARVISVLQWMPVEDATALVISSATGMTIGRVHVTLAFLEKIGRVTSEWVPGPYPRRRVYRLVTKEETEERAR